MTNSKRKRIATIVFYLLGMLVAGLMLVSWNESEIPPVGEPLSAAVKSISGSEEAVPLPLNDREPQNFAQPSAESKSGQ